MNKLNYLGLSLLFLSGCAGYKIVPPKEHDINNTFHTTIDSDVIWGSVVEWYGENNAPIDKVQKDSGLINSHWSLAPSNAIDCGKIDGNWSAKISDKKVKFNTVVLKKRGGTQVKFNLFGEATASQILPGGSLMEVKIRCTSTGAIEKLFIESISSNEIKELPTNSRYNSI